VERRREEERRAKGREFVLCPRKKKEKSEPLLIKLAICH